MMRRMGLLSLVVFCCWGLLRAVPVRAQFGGRETTKASIENFKLQDTMAMSEFLRVNVVDGLIEAKLVAPISNPAEPVRMAIRGSDAIWVVRNRPMVGGAAYTSITRYDFGAPADGFWSTGLTIRNNYVMIYAQTGDNASGMRVRLTQTGRSLRFSVSNSERGMFREIFGATADSIRQLQTEHPQEVRKYLAPAMKLICGHWLFKPGAADVYRVFEEIPPSPEVARRLDAILVMLEADSYPQREKASKALADLGAPGVLAGLRRNNSDLTIEAKNRLDLFIAAHTRLDLDDLRVARKDPNFLLDSLDDDDPAVRSAARAALEALAGKPIPFDVSLTGAARQQAIETLRRMPELQPKSPATRPAES